MLTSDLFFIYNDYYAIKHTKRVFMALYYVVKNILTSQNPNMGPGYESTLLHISYYKWKIKYGASTIWFITIPESDRCVSSILRSQNIFSTEKLNSKYIWDLKIDEITAEACVFRQFFQELLEVLQTSLS